LDGTVLHRTVPSCVVVTERFFQTESGQTKIGVRLENETVWLTQKSLAELFQTSVPNINMHLKNIFDKGELFRLDIE
jgi:hypothetical protein